jgi:hypothetical protein
MRTQALVMNIHAAAPVVLSSAVVSRDERVSDTLFKYPVHDVATSKGGICLDAEETAGSLLPHTEVSGNQVRG